MLDAALKAPDRWTYSDLAIAPPQADEFDALDLYHATTGGEAALKRKYRDDAIRGRGVRSTRRRSKRRSDLRCLSSSAKAGGPANTSLVERI